MDDLSKMTKEQLIAELRALRAAESTTKDGNGKFDEEELFLLAKGVEGDELFLVTETGRFVYVNDTMMSKLGYSREELLAMTLPRIDKVNSRATWLHRVSQLKQNRIPDVFETEQRASDGTYHQKEITALYVNIRSKNYVLCIGHDSAPSQQAWTHSTSVRSREQTFLQTTSDGVLVADTKGDIVEATLTAERLMGASRNEIVGRSCIDPRWRLIDTDGNPLSISSHPIMIALVEEHPVLNRTIGTILPNGTRRLMMVNASPLFDPNGELTGAVGFFRLFEERMEREPPARRETPVSNLFLEAIRIIIDSQSENNLERQICELLVRSGNYPLVWRGITQETDMRIHPSVNVGSEADYLLKIKMRYDDTEHGNGPVGRALKSGEPVTSADITTDPSYKPWKRQAEAQHLLSLVALPLFCKEEEAGVLVVYSRDRNHFIGAELNNLKGIAQLFSFGIYIQRSMDELRNVRAQNILNQGLLDIYHKNVPVAIAFFDGREPFRCEMFNEYFRNLLDEPFRSQGIDDQCVSDISFALYHRDLYDQLYATGLRAKTTSEEFAVFTDWQGKTSQWSWKIIPLWQNEMELKFLYFAWPIPQPGSVASMPSTSDTEASDSLRSDEMESGEKSQESYAGVISVVYPKLSARMKAATRVQRFLNEGQVLVLTPWAADVLGSEFAAPAFASDVFSATIGTEEFLTELLMSKDATYYGTLKSKEGEPPLAITAITFVEGNSNRVWMFLQPSS